jgi:hypothetical protein
MECRAEGMCDALLPARWLWDGQACQEYVDSGCSLVGPDCERSFETRDACERAMTGCAPAGVAQ